MDSTNNVFTDEGQSLFSIEMALETLRERKPNDRSSKDRIYAVAITDLEHTYAYFKTYAVETP